ncbi:E3 ubiquitin-protein ligase SPL2 [Impatiens glandulifera]|uniref:E3 ubiquitin-protein ligase SPL2 n=1 Tax=Impatiens glandulifera TaxID=253017 RepID=UPI001FB1612E|nr:E3 ubiquitin-protein ligase SPL2 [Impatiens glandulifera]
MSVDDQAAAAILSQVALAADGAILGLAIAYVAVRSVLSFKTTSAALRKIRHAPSVQISDLRSIATSSSDGSSDPQDILVVHGVVESKSSVDRNWRTLPNVLVSHESREKGVISQRSVKWIYNKWRGFSGWTAFFRTMFARSLEEQESSSIRMVPFVLVEGGRGPQSDYVIVNMEGSNHPLPLVTAFHQLQPVDASPFTFVQALFGHEYPVGLVEEEKILPLGKDITAVGNLSLKDGIAEIRSCKDLPCFLSEKSKDEIVADLDSKVKYLLWSGVILSSVAIGVLGYAAVRNWARWKEWKQQRRAQEQNGGEDDDRDEANAEEGDDEDTEPIPDGQLCVICLSRRRKSAFVPCGHLVCCSRCASSVGRYSTPLCPVCRQDVSWSLRIYQS